MSACRPGELFPAPLARWVAWRRPSWAARRVWVRVAEADTEAEAWQRLYAVMDQARFGSWDNVVLPEGEKP